MVFYFGRGDRTRTYNQRFWRPLLYQLSYAPSLLQVNSVNYYNMQVEYAGNCEKYNISVAKRIKQEHNDR